VTQDNVALMREGTQRILNENRLDLVDELFTDDFVDHDGSITRDRAGFKEYFGHLRDAFPDYRMTIEQELSEGELVLQRVTFSGTHQGEFNGVPPTNRSVTIAGFDLFRLEDGKVAEHWAQFDSLGLLQQIGVVPPPDAGPLKVLATIGGLIARGVGYKLRGGGRGK
jgi:steroid delta-isomerase-like uncharacterized protein